MNILRPAFFAVVLFVTPLFTFAADLYVDTTKKELNSGDTIISNVRINVLDECVNAISAEVHYDTTYLDAIDFSRGESLITLWIEEPLVDREKGTVRFAGGIPGGYCGRVIGDPALSNTLGRIIFTAVPESIEPNGMATTSVSIASSSEVLLNDGFGTPAAANFGSVELTLVRRGGPIINDWLQTVRADITAPEPFEIKVQRNDAMYGGKYFIAFSTIDKQTGVNHYEILETNPSLFGFDILTNRQTHWKEVESPYLLRDQSISSRLMVKAIDEAGNERISTFDPPGSLPLKIILFELLQLSVIVLLIIGFAYLIYKNVRNVRSTQDDPEEIHTPEETEE